MPVVIITLLVAALPPGLHVSAAASNDTAEDGLSNLALGRPVYSSSVYLWGPTYLLPKYAVDGVTQYDDELSTVHPQIFSSMDGDYLPWLSVDLGFPAEIYRVVIWSRCDCCAERMQNAELRIGNVSISQPDDSPFNIANNPEAWKQIESIGLCAPQVVAFDTPLVGRWVTLQNLNYGPSSDYSNYNLQVTELQVFGKPAGEVVDYCEKKPCGDATCTNIYRGWTCGECPSYKYASRVTLLGVTGPSCEGYDSGYYLGCFTDSSSSRVLPVTLATDRPDMSPSQCAALARAAGLKLYGVQNGTRCFGGTDLQRATRLGASSSCKTPCSGDASQMCGGVGSSNVYALSNELGCFTDNTASRRLPTYLDSSKLPSRRVIMSPAICADRARTAGLPLYGLESSWQCWGGFDIQRAAALGSSGNSSCNVSCSGDSSQTCGGNSTFNLYLSGSIVDGLPNVARGRPAYASSFYKWGSTYLMPKYAVDGVTQYFDQLSANHPQIAHTADGDLQPWFSVDLGAPVPIVRVVIWNRCDCCQDRLQNSELRIGNTRVAVSTDRAKITNNTLVWKQTERIGLCAPKVITFDKPKVGRWVTLQNMNTDPNDESYVLQITELEVFGLSEDFCVKKPCGNATCTNLGDTWSCGACPAFTYPTSTTILGVTGPACLWDFCAQKPCGDATCTNLGDTWSCGECPAFTYPTNTTVLGASGPACQGYDAGYYLGCFADDWYRTLPTLLALDRSDMTPRLCAAFARAAGLSFYGVQYGSQCFGGTDLARATSLGPSLGCDMACAGDASKMCGGGYKNNIYALSTDLGCFQDAEDARRFPSYLSPSGDPAMVDIMTPAACGALAREQGNYLLYGLQYSWQCWAGNVTQRIAALGSSSSCVIPCTGDASQPCGGESAFNLYVSGSLVDGPRNLALGQPAYASSVYLWGSTYLLPKYAVDGVTQYDDELSADHPQIFHTADGDLQPWFSVDLGAPVTIVRVVIWNRCDCCQGRIQNSELRIGNVAISQPSDSAKITNNTLVWKQTERIGLCAPKVVTFDKPKVGRWVTLQNMNTDPTDHGYLQITELEVFGA